MKIVVSGPASATVLDTDEEITDPKRLQSLDGQDYSKDRCSKYLSESLEEIGIRGGVVRFAFDEQAERLRVITEYRTSRQLTSSELGKLVQETLGQWSDGIGEGEFLHRQKLGMDVSLYPFGAEQVKVEQIDDGRKVKKPRVLPLIKAIREKDIATAKQLLSEGADVNCKDKTFGTPLHTACFFEQWEIATLLLESGADVGATNRDGDTPLATLAASQGSESKSDAVMSLATAMLKNGANVDAVDRRGMTPLMWAANRGNLPLIRLLIHAGADVNARDRDKHNQHTVLMYAQHAEEADLLLHHGADPTMQNASGETAWEYALRNTHIQGYRKLAELLRSHGESKQQSVE
jgi:uncharacterized protein